MGRFRFSPKVIGLVSDHAEFRLGLVGSMFSAFCVSVFLTTPRVALSLGPYLPL